MRCPLFRANSIGLCLTAQITYVPGIGEMERWCFSRDFHLCPVFKEQRLEADGRAGRTVTGSPSSSASGTVAAVTITSKGGKDGKERVEGAGKG